MNFNNIKTFLKNNYKIIIICSFIIFLFYNKYENFTSTEITDVIKVSDDRIKGIFPDINNNAVVLDKQLIMKRPIALNSNNISIRGSGDANHMIVYHSGIDGVEIKGNKGVRLATNEGGAKAVVDVQKDNVTIDANLQLIKTIKINGNLRVNNKGMHIITINKITGSKDEPKEGVIRDNEGKEYNENDWVCMIAGEYFDFQDKTNARGWTSGCFKKDGLWYYQAKVIQEPWSAKFNILCIPKGYFSKIDVHKL
jgi:hypothetical protein